LSGTVIPGTATLSAEKVISLQDNYGFKAWLIHTYKHTYILYLNSSLTRALPLSILTTNYMNISKYGKAKTKNYRFNK